MTDADTHRTLASALVLALFLGALGVLAWTWSATRSSTAAFADREEVGVNHLGAGTVDVAIGDRTVLFAAGNLAAGDVATGALEVRNGGTLPLRYRLSIASDGGPLGDVLELVVWTGGSACGDTPPTDRTIWSPPLATVGASGPRTSPILGRLSQGQSQLVCMRADLPLSTPSGLQRERFAFELTAIAEHDLETES